MRVSYKQQEIVEGFRSIHGENFDYSLVRYVNANTKVDIQCRKCGTVFSQRASAHRSGQGCPKCRLQTLADQKSKIKEENSVIIIGKFQKVHGDQYDYGKLNYHGADKKVDIGCKKCGRWFKSFPNNHLRGKGCRMCAQGDRGQREKNENAKTIISEFQIVHGDKFDYSGVVYSGADVDVEIRCRVCGNVFLQTPACHKNGGCKKCADRANGKLRMDRAAVRLIDDFIGVHGDRYDYSKVVYQGDEVRIEIGCKKCGKFFHQSPGHHKEGNGCPRCQESHGERMVDRILTKAGVDFERQKKFNGCRDKRLLPFDFYLKRGEVQFVIEYNGGQHYKPVNRFGGEDAFIGVQKRDAIKKQFCESMGIRHIEIPHSISTRSGIEKMLILEGVIAEVI